MTVGVILYFLNFILSFNVFPCELYLLIGLLKILDAVCVPQLRKLKTTSSAAIYL